MFPPLSRICAVTIFTAFLSIQSASATLLWYSPLDGNATAVVGPNGAAVGAPTATADRNGNVAEAVVFNGASDYFNLGTIASSLSAGSMSFWARTDSHGNDKGAIAMGISGGAGVEYFVIQDRADGSWRTDVDNGSSRLDAFDNDPPVSTGTWHHVAATFANGGQLRMYINGVLQADVQTLSSSHDVANLGNWLVGAERIGSRFYAGALDDVGMWDEELTARKIAAIHGLGKFQALGLNHPAVDTIAGFTTLGQTVVVDSTTWEYVDGLAGSTGSTGGTLAGEDAFIVLDGGTGHGVHVFTGPTLPPTVVNSAATNIQATSATLGGEVTDNGGSDPTVILYYGDNDGDTIPGNWADSVDFGAQGSTFSGVVSNLSPSTTYFFRCFASNGGGSDWANSTSSFTTAAPPNPPTVVNNTASNVTFEEADINGTVTSSGGEAPNITLYYGDNDGDTIPGSWDNSVELGAQSSSFSNSLFFLTNGTTYYFRAFAENSGGSAWAPSTASFTTLAYSPPNPSNTPATNITGTAALVGGTITSTGGQAPMVTIYYGDNDGGTDIDNWDTPVPLGAQSADFSTTLSGLNPLTTYYFRCLAENAAGAVWAGPTLSFTTLDVSELIINEFMAANDGGLTNNPNAWYPINNQVPGTTDDWIEIHNTGATTLDLGGWHLTDDAGDLSMWTFPPGTNIASGGFLIVYASGNNAPDINGNLHTNFKLAAGGEYTALVRPALTVASEFGPGGGDYPAQGDDVSYGLHPLTSASVYFTSPTPGAANDAGGLAKVADTKFSPDRGYHQTAIDVTITTDTPGATIYYTTDGTEPVDAGGSPTGTALVYAAPIALTQTTSVRAAAVKSGFAPTNIDTHSYILLDIDNANTDGTDVAGLNTPFLQQTQPAGWGNLSSGDFNMDTNVSKATAITSGHTTSTAQTMLQGMRDIPTISISMDRDDFSGANGIYSNSDQKGFAWERACSAEFIPATGDTRKDWQENCGLRVQGGASRNPSSSPKHSLSFRFRAEYGSGKLRQELFPGSDVEEFNVIALRAGYNNSWIHRDSVQRTRGSMIRDQWIRQSMIDMGNAAGGEGFMAHIFINGLYWGVHNLCERGDASHYAAYNGGDEDLLDARNGGEYVDGDGTAWNEIAGVVAGGDWSKIRGVIDIDTYIDYQIINRFGGNADLKTSGNWRAAGGGPFPPGSPELMAPWQLYSWDAERTLEGQTSGTSPIDPMGVRGTLEGHAEYRILFADHLQKHFFNNGALTATATQARWAKYADALDRAIIAESARWGDHRGTLYTRDNQWLTEQSRLYNSYFPVRSVNVFNNYSSLFPDTDVPIFLVNAGAQHGGEIPPGGTLSITATAGTIYYTTDGSDPRLEGGSVNPNATAISSGATVTLPSSGLVRTRALDDGEWSALDEASFYLEALAQPGDLAITEIHYNPYRATPAEKAGGYTDAGEFEFIEIRNVSASAINLDGVAFTRGLGHEFGITTLAAGDYAVLVRNATAFAIRHPGAPITGTFTGSLDNAGEGIAYASASGAVMQDFTYDNSGQWPGRPDGHGSSLEAINTSGDYNASDNWRSSREFNGSPGNTGAGSDGRVLINEVLSHSDLPQTDMIELHNTTGSPIDIGGWILSDDKGHYPSFSIPATTLETGAYVTFDEFDFNIAPSNAIGTYSGTLAASPTTVTATAHGLSTGDTITVEGYGGVSSYNGTWEVTAIDANSFSIDTSFLDNHSTRGNWIQGRPFALSSSYGEDLWLLETDGSGRPVNFVDKVDFAAAFASETLGRWPNAGGDGTLVSMSSNTIGSVNLGAQVGPVIISEVMYFPDAPSEDNYEYVEICNTGTVSENLANWRLRGGADFGFTAAHSLAPGEALVIVAFDPVSQPTAAASFRAAYDIDATIPLAGPFTDGPLGNDTGTVRLQRPDSPPVGDPTFYPQVTEDAVTYFDSAPWPEDAAGDGDSLNRVGTVSFGNFASSWTGELPTPGGKRLDYTEWNTIWGVGGELVDFEGDGIPNGLEFALGLNPTVLDGTDKLPGLVIEGDNATMTYDRNLLLRGITYRVEYSTNLSTWATAPDSLISTINFKETRKASVPISSYARLFMRLAVDF